MFVSGQVEDAVGEQTHKMFSGILSVEMDFPGKGINGQDEFSKRCFLLPGRRRKTENIGRPGTAHEPLVQGCYFFVVNTVQKKVAIFQIQTVKNGGKHGQKF